MLITLKNRKKKRKKRKEKEEEEKEKEAKSLKKGMHLYSVRHILDL